MVDAPYDEGLVTVRFSVPVEGTDPRSGERFVADRHRVRAELMRQDANETVFVGPTGEIVARWETRLVERVDWPSPSEARPLPSRPGPGGGVGWRRGGAAPRAFEPWTEAETAQLAGEFQAGLSVAEMARRHRRERGDIIDQLKQLGLIDPDIF